MADIQLTEERVHQFRVRYLQSAYKEYFDIAIKRINP